MRNSFQLRGFYREISVFDAWHDEDMMVWKQVGIKAAVSSNFTVYISDPAYLIADSALLHEQKLQRPSWMCVGRTERGYFWLSSRIRLLIMNKPTVKEMHSFWERKETCLSSSPSKKPKPVSVH